MKTLIVYGTKHGTAEKCSNFLKDKVRGEVVTINIKKENMPDITEFNNIVIGGSIYMGQIQKEVKNFCMENINALKEKEWGFLYVDSMKKCRVTVKQCFPKRIINECCCKGMFWW